MIQLDWRPGQALAAITGLADGRLPSLAAKVAAQTYEDDIHQWIGAGHAFTSRTGATQQSIGWMPDGTGAVVYANAKTALFLEGGTGLHGPFRAKYKIAPKPGRKALRIPLPGGGDMFRRFVMHPGIKAQPFFFADFNERERHMLEAVAELYADKLKGVA